MNNIAPSPARSSLATPERSPTEQRLREELAACYRLIAHFRMSDLIFTHISVRLPGPEHHFLINPYGLMFDEITASNLVKIDLNGEAVEPSPFPVNPAGFVIHSAIHGAREDAQCVLHTHTKAGCAVAALQCGLLPVNWRRGRFSPGIRRPGLRALEASGRRWRKTSQMSWFFSGTVIKQSYFYLRLPFTTLFIRLSNHGPNQSGRVLMTEGESHVQRSQVSVQPHRRPRHLEP
ncbi:hypothetical protein PsexTeo8_60960 (plasmid) [Pseudomonas extremaustralis]|nr:hypothetical protein [Pseudomonas extremaustralis]